MLLMTRNMKAAEVSSFPYFYGISIFLAGWSAGIFFAPVCNKREEKKLI